MPTRLDEEHLTARAHVDTVLDTSAASTACARCSTARSTCLDEEHLAGRAHVDAVRDTSAAWTACARCSTARWTCLEEKHLTGRAHGDACATRAPPRQHARDARRRGRRASMRNTSLGAPTWTPCATRAPPRRHARDARRRGRRASTSLRALTWRHHRCERLHPTAVPEVLLLRRSMRRRGCSCRRSRPPLSRPICLPPSTASRCYPVGARVTRSSKAPQATRSTTSGTIS